MAVTAKLFLFLGASLIFSASAQRESFLTGLLKLFFRLCVLVCDTGIFFTLQVALYGSVP